MKLQIVATIPRHSPVKLKPEGDNDVQSSNPIFQSQRGPLRGPKTPEGKLRSAGNRCTHGLYSKCVVLKTESQQEFNHLREQYIAQLHPQNALEFALIQQMAAARWRIYRVWATETRLLNEAMDLLDPTRLLDPIGRITEAYSKLSSDDSAFQQIPRVEDRYHRQYHRALNAFLAARKVKNKASNLLNEFLIPLGGPEKLKYEASNLLYETFTTARPPINPTSRPVCRTRTPLSKEIPKPKPES